MDDELKEENPIPLIGMLPVKWPFIVTDKWPFHTLVVFSHTTVTADTAGRSACRGRQHGSF